MIKAYFGVGGITKTTKMGNLLAYRVTSPKDIAVILDHFDKYPLITQKHTDCLLFKQVIEKINRKEHLTMEGLKEIVGLKAAIN